MPGSRVVVENTGDVGGVAGGLPSRFLSLYSVFLASITGGRVTGIDTRATSNRILLASLEDMGAELDYARNAIRVESPKPRMSQVVLNANCNPLLFYFLAFTAPFYLKIGGEARILLGCREMGDIARKTAGLLVQLGARPRPLGVFSRGVIVEVLKPLRTPRFISLPPGSDALLASFILGLLSTGEGEFFTRFYGFLEPRTRLLQAIMLLSSLGVGVEERRNIVVLETGKRSWDEIRVVSGYAETGLLAGLASKGELVLEDLPVELGGEEELPGLLKTVGYYVRGEKLDNSIKLFLSQGSPKAKSSLELSAPQLLPAILSATIAMRTEVFVTGHGSLSVEMPRLDRLPRLLGIAGFEAVEEKGVLRVAPKGNGGKTVRCRGEPIEICYAILVGLGASSSEPLVFYDLDLSYLYSDMPALLYRLGLVIRE